MSGVTRYSTLKTSLTPRQAYASQNTVELVLASDYDTLRAANQRLEEEISKLKAVVANQSVRRFVGQDDQRKIDELVAAGIRASDSEKQRLESALRTLHGLMHHKATTPLELEAIRMSEAALAGTGEEQ